MLLPVALMLARAIGELALDDGTKPRQFLDVIGNPVVALLAGVIFGMVALGLGSGMNREQLSGAVGGALPAIGVRLATGSATVATITAAGIVTPLARDLDRPGVALLLLNLVL